MVLTAKVTLVPWDPLSELHREWLYKQRVECLWDMDKVNEIWKDAQLKGEKCIYWIVRILINCHLVYFDFLNIRNVDDEYQVLPSDESERSKPQSLIDTAASINAVPRQPSHKEFLPIGHISLDSKNEESKHIDLDIPTEGVFWIKSFFVRHSAQGKGIGRAAMDEVEAMAVKEPLWAKTLMLSTVEGGNQATEDFAKAAYGAVPKVRAWQSSGENCTNG